MFAYFGVGTESDEELWPKTEITHAPGASATTHRMADKDVHPTKCAFKFRDFCLEIGEGQGLRRFSMVLPSGGKWR